MFEPFIMRAALAGTGVALIAGVLGCFVVWRRMAYFGDSLAHSALAGIPLGLILGIGSDYGVLAVASVFSLFLVWLNRRRMLAPDTILGIIAHASLAIGMVAVALIDFPVFNLHSLLFGDILTVRAADIARIYGFAVVALAALLLNWDSLVLMTISEDVAKAEGVNIFGMNLLLVFLMALVVSVSIQVVGVLLVTSMLIVPAAAGRMLARSPEAMAALSCVVGIASVLIGIYGSLRYDTPSGPSIVAVAAAFFVFMFAFQFLVERYFRKTGNIS